MLNKTIISRRNFLVLFAGLFVLILFRAFFDRNRLLLIYSRKAWEDFMLEPAPEDAVLIEYASFWFDNISNRYRLFYVMSLAIFNLSYVSQRDINFRRKYISHLVFCSNYFTREDNEPISLRDLSSPSSYTPMRFYCDNPFN